MTHSTCPACGRRPSERKDHPAGYTRQDYAELRTCPDPIHDAADRYAEVGEEMERALDVLADSAEGESVALGLLVHSDKPHPDAAWLSAHWESIARCARTVLARLPKREEATDDR